MTLEEEYELSYYEELTVLSEDKEVYLVKNIDNNQIYVKKKMKIYNKEIYLRLKEANIKNIPQIIMCVEDNGELIVIEEYIHGRTISQIMEEKGLYEPEEAVGIIIDVCDVLEELHSLCPPIIHRDIKPHNIMINNDGVVKIIDFNAARQCRDKQSEDTYFMGTQEYAAPEQYGFGQSDVRTDIYALGITLNIMITGELPKNHLYEGRLGRIIKKCTEVEQSKRYRKVARLREALQIFNVEKVSEVKEHKTSKIRSFLPVGFRSGNIWQCCISAVAYFMITYICFSMVIRNEDGTLLEHKYQIIYRIGAWLIFIGDIFIIGNYKGIRNILPHYKNNKIANGILCMVYMAIYTFFVLLAMIIML